MFSLDDVEDESFFGEIGALIRSIREIQTHTKEKKELIFKLKKVCQRSGYIEFQGNKLTFHIGRIGQSYLYDVPIKKTGHLLKFRNRRVRVICVASGSLGTRHYMAGKV